MRWVDFFGGSHFIKSGLFAKVVDQRLQPDEEQKASGARPSEDVMAELDKKQMESHMTIFGGVHPGHDHTAAILGCTLLDLH